MRRLIAIFLSAIMVTCMFLPSQAAGIPYNLIQNEGFENADISMWEAEYGKIERSTSQKRSGGYSLRVYDRENEWGQVIYDVTDILKKSGPGKVYRISAFFYTTKKTNSPDEKLLVRLKILTSTNNTEGFWYFHPTTLPEEKAWKDAGDDTYGGYFDFQNPVFADEGVVWTGELKKAILIFGIPANTHEFYLDDVAFWYDTDSVPLTTTSTRRDGTTTTSRPAGNTTKSSAAASNTTEYPDVNSTDTANTTNRIDDDIVLSDTGTGITIKAGSGVIQEGTTLSVALVNSGSVFDRAKNLLKTVGDKISVFEVSLKNGDEDIQPNGTMKMSIPIPSGFNKNKLAVYHIESDNRETGLVTTVEGNFVVFNTDKAGTYVVVEKADVPGIVEENGGAIPLWVFIIAALASIAFPIGLLVFFQLKKKKDLGGAE